MVVSNLEVKVNVRELTANHNIGFDGCWNILEYLSCLCLIYQREKEQLRSPPKSISLKWN